MPAPRGLIDKLFKPKPDTEKTGRQAKGGIASAMSELAGYGRAGAGTYDTYRLIASYPTVAFADAIATSPVIGADHGWESDEDTPEERQTFISDQIEPRWRWLISNALRARKFGWQGFELVHELLDGAPWGLPPVLGYAKFKPLLVDITKIQEDDQTGAYRGLKQDRTTLPPPKTWLYVYDWSPGNLYGRSIYENIRNSAWKEIIGLSKKEEQYVTKVAAIIMILQYPTGQEDDEQGTTQDNFDLAKGLLHRVGTGMSVAMPNRLVGYYQALVEEGIRDPKMLKPWVFDLIEAKGQHGKEFVEQRRHKESLIFQGLLVPPRAGLEGQYGTKAEAEEHASVGLQVSEQLHVDIVEYINLYLVDPLLAANWGEEARGTVRIVPMPLVDRKRALHEKLIVEAAKNPLAMEALSMLAAVDVMAEGLGVPLAEAREAAVGAMEKTELEEPGGRAVALWRAAMGDGNGDD